MLEYKCWTCGNDMESHENMLGLRQDCPNCDTPNIVPKPINLELTDELKQCPFCTKRTVLPETFILFSVQKIEKHPMVQCRNCWEKWELRTVGAICPSCESREVFPIELPAMPISKHYERFSYTLGNEVLTLTGYVSVPSCTNCARTLKRIGVISVIASFAAIPIFILVLAMLKPGRPLKLTETAGVLIIGIIGVMFVGVLTKELLGRTLGKNISIKAIVTYPPIQTLRDMGWIHKQQAL